MRQKQFLPALASALLATLLVAPACANVNRSITIGDNTETGGESTVNGSISVGSGSTVNGSLDTVNGKIRIGENSMVRDVGTVNGGIRFASGVTARDVESVNGDIVLDQNVTVGGAIAVVNGKILVGSGSKVTDDLSNVNGEIALTTAEVGGNVSTVNGDVTLSEGAIIRGNLVIEKPNSIGINFMKRKPKIVIGANCRVAGNIELEREVELFISESAAVGGVTGAMAMEDAVRFSGDAP